VRRVHSDHIFKITRHSNSGLDADTKAIAVDDKGFTFSMGVEAASVQRHAALQLWHRLGYALRSWRDDAAD
jgi:hypothetical protein